MMRLVASALLAASLAGHAVAAQAAVDIQRQGAESPFIEVARTTMYGSMAGLLVGSAIAWADEGSSNEPVRWGFVIGTFGGLAAGIAHVSARPKASALLEWRRGRVASGSIAALEAAPGGVRVSALQVEF